MHDTLQKLYTTGISGERDIKLNVSEFNIESIWMFANVSPIITKLSGFPGPTESLVKPGAGGCAQIFVNTFNSWDPFTLEKINRFNPPDEWTASQFVIRAQRSRTSGIVAFADLPLGAP